jgi:glycosyltransferase involved in cell wall biosynthesis
MKIAVYSISKNEEQFVERFCEAAKDADYIVVGDTGSTDDTMDALRAVNVRSKNHIRGFVRIHEIHIRPWRFDRARDAVLALVPLDVDVCVSLDLDEILQPGWRAAIEAAWKPDTTRLRYLFDWGAGIAFYYEKIHARWGYRWRHPCHEHPVPDGRINEVYATVDQLLVIHKPDNTKSRKFYFELLKEGVEEDPWEPRIAFYFARELSFNGKWNEAIAESRRYLGLPRANWVNERCYAYRIIGRCFKELMNPWEAEKAFLLAVSEAPGTREPWHELAWLMYDQKRWPECYAYGMKCLSITNKEPVYTVDPHVWGASSHDVVAIAAWNLGLKPQALEQAHIAARMSPDDFRLSNNLKHILENQ